MTSRNHLSRCQALASVAAVVVVAIVPGAAVELRHPSIDALLARCDFEIKLAVHRMIDEMQERILPGRAYDAEKRRNLIEIADRHLTPLAADPNLFAEALRKIAGS
jgi:hypothetical protein